jgi:hypothetical protein
MESMMRLLNQKHRAQSRKAAKKAFYIKALAFLCVFAALREQASS